jgi:stage II sporulation protein P
MNKSCLECGETIRGRSDKKFCDDQCRSNYNNRLLSENTSVVKQVNSILKKNRQILERHNPEAKTRVKQATLRHEGFNFDYHTHTYEAYKPTPENTYEPTEKWRTKDNRYNVVRIGEELARLLTAAGFDVVHDTTAYEPPVLGTSYTRSLKMLEDSMSRGEKYDLYIDLHRNASSATAVSNNTVQVGDQKIARMMMLIGDGSGVTSAGFDARPDWEKNLNIAQAITDSLNEQVPELCRPVKLTKQRYNQHVAPNCILIEAGNNINTLEEALASVPYLADAIRSVLSAQSAQ